MSSSPALHLTTGAVTTQTPVNDGNDSSCAGDALARARRDIHCAVGADTAHQRRQYALAARDHTAEVLTNPAATRAQREYAGYYWADAQAMLTEPMSATRTTTVGAQRVSTAPTSSTTGLGTVREAWRRTP